MGGPVFFTSKRLLPKSPKNEVLVAAEPGKCPQNEYQKADVGEIGPNLDQTPRKLQGGQSKVTPLAPKSHSRVPVPVRNVAGRLRP